MNNNFNTKKLRAIIQQFDTGVGDVAFQKATSFLKSNNLKWADVLIIKGEHEDDRATINSKNMNDNTTPWYHRKPKNKNALHVSQIISFKKISITTKNIVGLSTVELSNNNILKDIYFDDFDDIIFLEHAFNNKIINFYISVKSMSGGSRVIGKIERS